MISTAARSSGLQGLTYQQLHDSLERLLTESSGIRALLLLDVDDAIELQGRLGFSAASALLTGIAARFAESIGERGTVHLLGEDRICALLNTVRNAGHAVLAAEKLTRLVEETLTDGALTFGPRTHTGIALYPQMARSAEGLLRHAQLAALAARSAGQRTRVFDASCEQQAVADWQLSDELALALRSGALSVFLQPKIELSGGRLVGAEGLMRWIDDLGAAVAAPDRFVKVAEQAGLIQELTWFALTNALQHSLALGALPVAVNITPGMLHHADLPEMVRTALATWNIGPGALTLEVTESALVGDPQSVRTRLTELRELGARIAIDDFGTGYSSLSYFRTLTADELKIDRSFIADLRANEPDERIVSTILTLAREFKMRTVAEGVEDGAVLEQLHRMGCDEAQGFWVSPPLPFEAFARWSAGRERPRAGVVVAAHNEAGEDRSPCPE